NRPLTEHGQQQPNSKCNSDGQECPSHTGLHGADSDIAANIFHARNQNIAGIKQTHRSHNVSNGLHSFHFTPETQYMQKKFNTCKSRELGCAAESLSCRIGFLRVRSKYIARLRKYNIGMADDLLRYRSQFPILERSTYLISNSLGAMPQAVYEALKGYADIWATRGVRAWEERWWMLAAQVGDE